MYCGRINFHPALRGEQAGITNAVHFAGKEVTGWSMYSLPLNKLPQNGYSDRVCHSPCLYRASFNLDKVGDTFLMRGTLARAWCGSTVTC